MERNLPAHDGMIGTVMVFQANHALSCVFFRTWHCVIDLGDHHREIPGLRFFSYVGLGVALFMDPGSNLAMVALCFAAM
ncbi:hypothetical protein ACFX13_001202 [Malus domestica]